MNDNELDLNLDNIEAQQEENLKIKNRIEKLSEKVILTGRERDELAKAKEELEKVNLETAKERDFYKDFSSQSSKYPNANEYQDKIWEKVNKGYTTEDAIVSVLNTEGKLTSVTPESPRPNIEGGSAQTQTFGGDKEVSDMSVDEKRAALLELDKAGGIEQALRGKP